MGYGFRISLTVLEKTHDAEPRWMCGPGRVDMLFSVVAEGGMEEPFPGADNLVKGEELLQTAPSKCGRLGRVPSWLQGREVHGGDTSRKAGNGAGGVSLGLVSWLSWITRGWLNRLC